MNLFDEQLSVLSIWLSIALLALAGGTVLPGVPWRALRRADYLHRFAGSIVALMCLWSLGAGLQPGLQLHLLGLTVLTLMFGPGFALLGAGVVLAAVTAYAQAGWSAYAANLLLMGALPIGLTQALLVLARMHLAHHVFVFIFVNAFLAGGLCIVLAGVLGALLLWLEGAYSAAVLGTQFLSVLPLLVFPEAFVNGLLVTLLVAFRPHWVAGFSERVYLIGK